MTKHIVTKPFFVVNPKSYLCGEKLLELAILADELSCKHNITIFVTAPYSDLASIAKQTSHIIVTAQHLDGISYGRGMGAVLPESLKNIGVKATFLNHAEKPLTLSALIKAMNKANELGILTIVCADSLSEAKAISVLRPDIVLCEPTELIGTGKTSDEDYIQQTNEIIKSMDANILVMQAAGISSPEDVYRTILLGADGTGCTSGIVCAPNPSQMLKQMIESLVEAFTKRRM